MTFSPEHLESLTTKEDVIEYAASFGIDGLNKKRKIETLKQNVLDAYKPAPSVSLFAALEAETAKEEIKQLSPNSFGDNVDVFLRKEKVETIPLSALEHWCSTHNLPYDVVKVLVDLPHLHHNHYSFRKS